MSRATVTPSLVIVGAPHFFSKTTLRPLGPSVTLTASASLLTPLSSLRRASSWNFSCFAICAKASFALRYVRALARGLLLDDGQDVAGRQDEVLLATELDLGAAVLGVHDGVTLADVEWDALTLVGDATWADRNDRALLGLLLGGVRDDQATGCRLLGLVGLNDDAVLQGLDSNLGCGRHASSFTFQCSLRARRL